MQVTEKIHALKIPFQIPVSPEMVLDRIVYSYFVFSETITLVDTGVAGSETMIFDYIRENGRDPQDITAVILTHAHPDHIGSVKVIKDATGCTVMAHDMEKGWIEDTEKQYAERPVPWFHSLVAGPVTVDRVIGDGDVVDLGGQTRCHVIHTPGHSAGSMALHFPDEKSIITGDAVPLPGALPIYDDVVASVASIKKLKRVHNVDVMLSSWEDPIVGSDRIAQRLDAGLSYLRRVHECVLDARGQNKGDVFDVCRQVVAEIGLPPSAVNPLVTRSMISSLSAAGTEGLFD